MPKRHSGVLVSNAGRCDHAELGIVPYGKSSIGNRNVTSMTYGYAEARGVYGNPFLCQRPGSSG